MPRPCTRRVNAHQSDVGELAEVNGTHGADHLPRLDGDQLVTRLRRAVEPQHLDVTVRALKGRPQDAVDDRQVGLDERTDRDRHGGALPLKGIKQFVRGWDVAHRGQDTRRRQAVRQEEVGCLAGLRRLRRESSMASDG